MDILQNKYGELDGKDVYAYTMKNSRGMEITCLNYGCIITKILMPDAKGNAENIVLGFDHLDDYLHRSPYFGAVVGRVAGRIKNGEFALENKTYHVTQNEGINHLHGGYKGFSHVIWDHQIVKKDDAISIEFYYRSADGEEGYPGNLDVKVVYSLNEENQLRISYQGRSDKTTLMTLTNHTYFNLSGNLKRDILQHRLMMKSDRFLELGRDLLPTGQLLTVDDTPFDFRSGRLIQDGVYSNHEQILIADKGYDHGFLLNRHHDGEIVLADSESGRQLVVETDEPCVVLYTGTHLEEGFDIYGVPSRKYLGLCLETQGVPDSIHHPELPQYILKKGETYVSESVYSFQTLTE